VVERTMGADSPATQHQLAFRATEWVQRNGDAFLSAYAGRELTDDEQVQLDAYLADKAIYEAVYEAAGLIDRVAGYHETIARLTGVTAP